MSKKRRSGGGPEMLPRDVAVSSFHANHSHRCGPPAWRRPGDRKSAVAEIAGESDRGSPRRQQRAAQVQPSTLRSTRQLWARGERFLFPRVGGIERGRKGRGRISFSAWAAETRLSPSRLRAVDLRGLRPLLRRFLEKFQSEAYKKTFPWVDQISEVKNKALADKLDEEVCKLIDVSRPRCWLGIPEIIDWTRVGGFQFSFKPKAPEYADIRLADFVDSLEGDPATPHLLVRRGVHAVDGDGAEIRSWSIS